LIRQIKRLSDDVFELPDGSLAYSMKRAAERFPNIKPVDYSVSDLVLFILNSQKGFRIRGRTILFKEIFLMEQEVFSEFLFNWDQVPGDDTSKLTSFLSEKLGMIWVKEARIRKMDDGKAIAISNEQRTIILSINHEKTNVILRGNMDSYTEHLYNFFIRESPDGHLKIYAKTERVEDCKFVPYQFGPYSFHVEDTLENLAMNGLISRSGKKGTTVESFKITPRGSRAIRNKYLSLSTELRQKIGESRKGYEQFSTDGILNYVYTNYPQYSVLSRIANRYKSMTWGKSRG